MHMILAACGNDCAVCPRFVATRSGDSARLQAVAELWVRCGWRDTVVTPEEIACRGCATATWCRYGIRACTREKGIAHCGHCATYPCDKIAAAFERTALYRAHCQQVCSSEECASLQAAFFDKQRNLEEKSD